MRELLTATVNATGVALLECPKGKTVRLAGVTANITPATAGDQVTLTFARGQDTLLVLASPPLSATNTFGAAVGIVASELVEDIVDPVTGVVTYRGDQLGSTMALPDLWWPYEMLLTIAMFNGTIGVIAVIYERTEKEGGCNCG